MQIPVLIERIAQNGYRAKTGEPLALSVEAATREEAMAKLREEVAVRLQNGTQLVALDVVEPAPENPWVKYAGMFKDDPMFKDVCRIMEENRKKDDADPDYL